MKIRGSVASLIFIFPHPPEDKKKKKGERLHRPAPHCTVPRNIETHGFSSYFFIFLVWLVLLCFRTRYAILSLALLRSFAIVSGFLSFSLWPHNSYLAQDEESARTLGVLMSLGRNNGLW